MHEVAGRHPGSLVTLRGSGESDFEARLADCATLAVRVAYGVLRNREDAEEVAQEAFTRAYRRFSLLRDRERFRAWLARIAWRLALDRQRADRRRARRELAAAVPLPEPSVEEVAVRAEFEAHLWGAVQELPEKLRVVVILCAMEEHGVGEAARLLRLPEGTVKSRLHLARRALAEKLRWLVTGTTRT
ncbi:MAG TPA: RNA polymerase sigma factor [Vicinamibacteria bacterium]|jgi:RNA polymerase sigma-70 factor (ECF subfamily)|nr:RNA polymerase sigma factor [Vicinamibacteria bacterium]